MRTAIATTRHPTLVRPAHGFVVARRARRARRARTTLSLVALLALVLFATRARADRDDDAGDEREVVVDVNSGIDLETDGASPSPSPSTGPTLLAALRSPPAVGDVLEAAYAAAGLDRSPTTSWIRRARVAGLVPWVTLRTGWDASWRDETPGEVGRGRTFEVRATWRLDRLLFDGRELQISSIDAARRRERRRLASQVIRAYFAWRKVAALAARNPARFALAAEAATAELDALTDGWFSDRGRSTR